MSQQNDTPVDTKPDNGPPASAVSDERPADDAPERFAALVATALDERVAALISVEAGTRKAVRDLADAFGEHTTDEAKRHAAMLKVLAVRSATPTAAIVLSIVAVLVALGVAPAQADSRCPPTVVAP